MKKQIDRFVIGEPLGGSGMGSVYRADELLPGGLRRSVALKVLPVLGKNDKAAEERFYNELRAIMAMEGHPNIVTFHAMGMFEGAPWLAMEFVPNNLTVLLSEQPAPPADVARMIEQVAGALSFMHHLNPPLLHNDLKPANILVDRFGAFKLADFGLTSLVAADRTHVLATVRYAAPELLSRDFGKVGPATDLYALGHIAYEMALGGRAYRTQFPAVFEDRQVGHEVAPAKWMAWHCSMETVPTPLHEIVRDFPRPLSDLIARLMLKRLDERAADAAQILQELRQMGSAAPAAPIRVPPRLPNAPAAGANAPKPATTSGPPKYWVRLRGKITGPFDLPTLQRQAKQGAVSRLHQISTDQVAWRSATSLEGVFAPVNP